NLQGSDVPVQIPGLTGVTAIAAGSYDSYAVGAGGRVWAWGDNHQGQLGDGTFTDSMTPMPVSGLSNVVALTAGGWSRRRSELRWHRLGVGWGYVRTARGR